MSSPTEVPTLMRSTTPLRLPSLPMRIFLPHRRRRHLKFRPPSPSPALRRGPEVIPFSNPKSLLPLLCARPWIQSWLLLAVLSPVITMLICSQHLFRNRRAASCAAAVRLVSRALSVMRSASGVKWLSTRISSGCVWSS